MLFDFCPTTTTYSVFTDLNQVLLDFLRLASSAEHFDETLFPTAAGKVCYANNTTRRKFEQLFLSIDETTQFDFVDIQELGKLFNDKTTALPNLSKFIKSNLAKLTKHLFESTKNLAGIKQQQCIKQHYQTFIKKHGTICGVCGTAELSQPLADTKDSKQPRSDYDHLLCQKDYPMYAVHPHNILPTCYICNQKSKDSKNLLVDKQGNRRMCFHPFSEPQGCDVCIDIQLIDGASLLPKPSINWQTPDDIIQQKLDTWDDVYSIKSRVLPKIKDLAVWLAIEFKVETLEEFRKGIKLSAKKCQQHDFRQKSWLFWYHRVYLWLANEGADQVEAIWAMIKTKQDTDACNKVYGNFLN